jgi:hypothetical protein
MSMKNFNDIIANNTRDLPNFTVVPKPIARPRVSIYFSVGQEN